MKSRNGIGPRRAISSRSIGQGSDHRSVICVGLANASGLKRIALFTGPALPMWDLPRLLESHSIAAPGSSSRSGSFSLLVAYAARDLWCWWKKQMGAAGAALRLRQAEGDGVGEHDLRPQGAVLGRIFIQNRDKVRHRGDLAAMLLKAVVAAEDNRFYQHNGVDYYGIVPRGGEELPGGQARGRARAR